MYVAREAKERDAGNAFPRVSLLVYGDDQFAGVLPKTPAYMTRTGVSQRTLLFKAAMSYPRAACGPV